GDGEENGLPLGDSRPFRRDRRDRQSGDRVRRVRGLPALARPSLASMGRAHRSGAPASGDPDVRPRLFRRDARHVRARYRARDQHPADGPLLCDADRLPGDPRTSAAALDVVGQSARAPGRLVSPGVHTARPAGALFDRLSDRRLRRRARSGRIPFSPRAASFRGLDLKKPEEAGDPRRYRAALPRASENSRGGFVRETLRRMMGTGVAGLAIGLLGCSAPKPSPKVVPPSPTPFPLSATNPNIVEEDAVHIVERFPKDEYIRVDAHHIRNPLISAPVEFFKEDDQYYYVYTYKRSAELDALNPKPTPTATPTLAPGVTPTPAGPTLAEFEDLAPPRVTGRLRLEPVAESGLPINGLWRASFVVADINGDGIPDIIAPPPRLGPGSLWV